MLKEINVSHHQKKKLIKAIKDERVMFVEDNGDVVINVKAYPEFVAQTHHDPLKSILGDTSLDDNIEYLVIQ
jgi:hypothetical protein